MTKVIRGTDIKIVKADSTLGFEPQERFSTLIFGLNIELSTVRSQC
jgi:hypothetical protein